MTFRIAEKGMVLTNVLKALRADFRPAVKVRGGWAWHPRGEAWSDTVCYLRHGFLYQDAPDRHLMRPSTLKKAAVGQEATPAQLGEFYELALCGHESK